VHQLIYGVVWCSTGYSMELLLLRRTCFDFNPATDRLYDIDTVAIRLLHGVLDFDGVSWLCLGGRHV
jgi:hypothetical protein